MSRVESIKAGSWHRPYLGSVLHPFFILPSKTLRIGCLWGQGAMARCSTSGGLSPRPKQSLNVSGRFCWWYCSLHTAHTEAVPQRLMECLACVCVIYSKSVLRRQESLCHRISHWIGISWTPWICLSTSVPPSLAHFLLEMMFNLEKGKLLQLLVCSWREHGRIESWQRGQRFWSTR